MFVLCRMCEVSSIDVSGVDISVHIAAKLSLLVMEGGTETDR